MLTALVGHCMLTALVGHCMPTALVGHCMLTALVQFDDLFGGVFDGDDHAFQV
jgi:hypothetical protein